MKVLITGGSSYLGQHLVPIARQHHDVVYTYFTRDPLALSPAESIDLRDTTATEALIKRIAPDAIIHLAASNRGADIESSIVGGATGVVAGAKAVGAKLVHMSTDVVFNGEDGPYRESAEPNPIHLYGQSKAQAEKIVATYPNHVIVRTSLIYSLRLLDQGTSWMKRDIEAGKSFTLFTDHLRNPVHADDLSHACLELASNNFSGIINIAGAQSISRAIFAQKMLAYWGIDYTKQVSFGPDTTDNFPRDCRLDLSLARSILSTQLRGLDDVLTAASQK